MDWRLSIAAPRVPFSWAAPTTPLAIAALLAPFIAVLQSKAMAPVALLALLPCILLSRRSRGVWPLPDGPALWSGVALGLWAAVSAAWAPEPGRAIAGGLSFVGLVLLAGAGYRAAREDDPAHRRRLAWALLAGLVLGLGAALFDHLSGSALRAAVRGLREIPPNLAFGLKPATSVMALLLPLLAGFPLPHKLRVGLMLLGGAILLLVAGDTAKLAALAGLGLTGLVALELYLRQRRGEARPWTPCLLGLALAGVMLLTPVLLGPALARLGPTVEALPPSAIHRLVIWDFVLQRAEERPWTGWGMEASRALPGGKEKPQPEELARLGIQRPDLRAWFAAPHIEKLPLHPHNGALQIRLELGWVGSLLAAFALFFLALACLGPAAAAATGCLASAFVTFLASFGAWQSWWLCSTALAIAILGALQGGTSAGTRGHPDSQ